MSSFQSWAGLAAGQSSSASTSLSAARCPSGCDRSRCDQAQQRPTPWRSVVRSSTGRRQRAAPGETPAGAQGQQRGRRGFWRRLGQPFPRGEDPGAAAGRCPRCEAARRCHGNGLRRGGGPREGAPRAEDRRAEVQPNLGIETRCDVRIRRRWIL